MLSRFELFVVVRRQLGDRRLVTHALAIEAVMEKLAAAIGEPADTWGLAGLGADIDVTLTEDNIDRQGEVAEEMLLTEGAPAEVAAAARERRQLAPETMTRMAAGLVVATGLVDEVYDALTEGPLDTVETLAIAHRLRRAAEKRGDEDAIRVLRCAARLDLPLERAAELALGAMLRVREDLRL